MDGCSTVVLFINGLYGRDWVGSLLGEVKRLKFESGLFVNIFRLKLKYWEYF